MACTGEAMSFYRPEWGSDGVTLNFGLKRKFNWLFDIQNITDGDVVSNPLPCVKASRPKLNFREMQAEHLNETISFPSKPEWQPIQIVLYDRCTGVENPIMTWLKQQYNPSPSGCSAWYPCIDPLSYKVCAELFLLDGCGEIVEKWILEHCYAQNIDFGDLDMTVSDIVTANVTLKYDRAYQTYPEPAHTLYTSSRTACSRCENPICDESVTTDIDTEFDGEGDDFGGGGGSSIDASGGANSIDASGGPHGVQTGNNDSTDIPPGITKEGQGDIFYNSSLNSDVTPFHTNEGVIFKDNSTGIYWRTMQSPSLGPGFKVWQRWSNGTWSRGSLNPLTGGGPVLPFAAMNEVRMPDFIMI